MAPGKLTGGLGAAVNVPSPLPKSTETPPPKSTARSGIPSPLKSAVKTVLPLFGVICETVAGKIEEPAKSKPVSVVSAAVPSTAFPLLVSRNDTMPVGKAFPSPGTVAVNEKMFGIPLDSMYVVVATGDATAAVTVSGDAVEALGPKLAGSAKTTL